MFNQVFSESLPPPNITELSLMSFINVGSGGDELPNVNKAPQSENTERNSISRPEIDSIYYTAFMGTLLCGSCNDFVVKLICQMLPRNDSSHDIDALTVEYWITLCSIEIFNETARTSCHKLHTKLFMDFVVTGGRYLVLVFLSAAVVSIMRNGTQLLFLAVFKVHIHNLKSVADIYIINKMNNKKINTVRPPMAQLSSNGLRGVSYNTAKNGFHPYHLNGQLLSLNNNANNSNVSNNNHVLGGAVGTGNGVVGSGNAVLGSGYGTPNDLNPSLMHFPGDSRRFYG